MRSPALVLAIVTAGQAASGFFVIGLPAVGPQFRSAYDLSLPELGIVVAAPSIGGALALIAMGAAVDRFGSRTTMILGAAISVPSLVVAATAQTTGLLVAMLVVAGAGGAALPVAGLGSVFRAYPPERRGFAVGVRQMGGPGGGIIAAAIAPLLAALRGVDLVLYAAAALIAIAALAFVVFVPDDRPSEPRRGLALGAVCRQPGLWRLMLVVSLLTVVVQALFVYTLPAARAAGLSAFAAGAAFFGVQVTAVFTRLAWGRRSDRDAGRQRVRTLVEVCCVAAAGALLYAGAVHLGPVPAVAAAVVFAIGASGWNSIYVLILGELGPPELIGQAFAFTVTICFVVQAVGAAGLGFVADYLGWTALWTLTSALALAAAVFALRLPRTRFA